MRSVVGREVGDEERKGCGEEDLFGWKSGLVW